MKTLTKYLLMLSLLLLSGYGCMYAGAHRDYGLYFPVKIFKNAGPGSVKGRNASEFGNAVSGTEENVKICSEEKEEEHNRTLFQRTYTRVGNYLPTIYKTTPVDYDHSPKKYSWFFKHWFYASSNRFIVLGVLRI